MVALKAASEETKARPEADGSEGNAV